MESAEVAGAAPDEPAARGASRAPRGTSRARVTDAAAVRSEWMRRLRSPKFWAGCGMCWALLALSEATTIHIDAVRAGRASSLGLLLFDRALSDLCWPIVVAIVFARMERLVARTSVHANVARAIAAPFALLGLALAPFFLAWGPAARTLAHGRGFASFVDDLRHIAGSTYLWVAILYTMTTLTACILLFSQRSQRHERDSIALQARLTQAELDLLRAQLEPHFLFNALNTIAGLIRASCPDLATAALAKLSELLRYVVEASRHDRVPLAWELEFAASYLEMQQLRYGARMRLALPAASTARGVEVPPLLLQPLIENAVVHAVARTAAPVAIEVHVEAAARVLRIRIDNTRDPHATPDPSSTGVGLRNTRERLARMYGDAFLLEAGPIGDDRYRVAIELPDTEASA